MARGTAMAAGTGLVIGDWRPALVTSRGVDEIADVYAGSWEGCGLNERRALTADDVKAEAAR